MCLNRAPISGRDKSDIKMVSRPRSTTCFVSCTILSCAATAAAAADQEDQSDNAQARCYRRRKFQRRTSDGASEWLFGQSVGRDSAARRRKCFAARLSSQCGSSVRTWQEQEYMMRWCDRARVAWSICRHTSPLGSNVRPTNRPPTNWSEKQLHLDISSNK